MIYSYTSDFMTSEATVQDKVVLRKFNKSQSCQELEMGKWENT